MADFEKLKQNVIDMLEEQQQKLGYQKETIRLYYPLESLNHLLGTEVEKDGTVPSLSCLFYHPYRLQCIYPTECPA